MISVAGDERNIGEGWLQKSAEGVPELRVAVGIGHITGKQSDIRFDGGYGLDGHVADCGGTDIGEYTESEGIMFCRNNK